MTTYRKLLERILSGRSDANVRFDDLTNLLTRLGFEERSRGSHHVFIREGVEDLINLQREGHMAKPYRFDRFELLSPNTDWIKKGTTNA